MSLLFNISFLHHFTMQNVHCASISLGNKDQILYIRNLTFIYLQTKQVLLTKT